MTNRPPLSDRCDSSCTTTAMRYRLSVKAQGANARNNAGTIKTRDGAESSSKTGGRAARSF